MCYRIFPDDHKIRLGNEENDWRPKGGQIALHHHHTFFNSNLSDLKLPRHFEGQLASVNCISWLGSSFAKFEGKVGKTDNEDMAEEPWFIKQAAKNCIYPQMVTCHYAFANQRTPLHTWFGEGLDLDSTTVLQKYQEISKQQLTKQLLFV